jgi:hypothetical protein
MRAANRAQSSTAATDHHVAGLLTPLVVAVIAIVALLLVWPPTVVHAAGAVVAVQKPALRTQVVKADQTGSTAPKVGVAVPAEADTTRADLKPTTGTIMGQAGGGRIGLVDQESAMASRKADEVQTVFHRDLPDAAEAERRTRAVLRPNPPTPRLAEFLAAPYLTSARSLKKLGRITARVGPTTSGGDRYSPQAITTEEVELRSPVDQAYKIGDRLLAFEVQDAMHNDSVVVRPTGVLEVVKVDAGKPDVALIRRQSGRIEVGQRLVFAPIASAQWVEARRVDTADVPTSITWLDEREAQPTLQSYVIIGAGSAKGLSPGDELAIYRRIAKGTTETPAATARVVRVERDHATAIITRQYQTDIAVGMRVRRYAKAP